MHATAILALLAVTSCGLAPTAWAQTKVTNLVVVDRSEGGTPFHVTGEVRLKETVARDQVYTSMSQRIMAKNVSNQTVLMFVASIEVTPTFGAKEQSTRQYECFFATDVIAPGDEHALSEPRDEGGFTIQPHSTSAPLNAPEAEVKILYVQFINGSEYGQRAFASDLLRLRRITWSHLKRLVRTYERSGEVGFLEELYERIDPGEVDVFFENIRQTARSRGAQSALARVHFALKLADERTAGFIQKSGS